MGAVIEFQRRERVFYANHIGPITKVIALPRVYPKLSPSERAKQLRRWFNRRTPTLGGDDGKAD